MRPAPRRTTHAGAWSQGSPTAARPTQGRRPASGDRRQRARSSAHRRCAEPEVGGRLHLIWTAEGWLYVAAVVDLFPRRVVGKSISDAMTAQLVSDALVMAIWRRGRADALLHHSDQAATVQLDSKQDQNVIQLAIRLHIGTVWLRARTNRRSMRFLLALSSFALLGVAPSPPSASIRIIVRAPNGSPVTDAVVIVRLVGRDTPLPRVGSGYAVSQQNIQFHPFISVVPINADVAFPNLDSVRHQVYSFSPAKRFQLKLYAREQNRTVRFDRAGPVSLGCNIHDQMTAYLYVVDSAFAARTDGSGRAVLNGVPEGAITIAVWHPYLRAPGNQLSRRINLTGSATENFVAPLRPPPAAASSN